MGGSYRGIQITGVVLGGAWIEHRSILPGRSDGIAYTGPFTGVKARAITPIHASDLELRLNAESAKTNRHVSPAIPARVSRAIPASDAGHA